MKAGWRTLIGMGLMFGIAVQSAAADAQPGRQDPVSSAAAIDAIELHDELDSPPASHSRVIEEIVVTAQKQSESITDVPISISALSGENMRETGVSDLLDVSNRLVGVQVNPEQNRAYIRGFGSAANQTVEQSVAVVIDGIYYGRTSYLRSGFLDLERLEVLRGPQSTLFGKNAVAGVLSFITADPDSQPQGWLSLQGGELGQRQAEGAITGPLIEGVLDVRLAGGYRNLDGYIYNSSRDEWLDGVRTTGIRAKGGFHLGDKTELLISLEYGDKEQGAPAWQVHTATDNLRETYSRYDPDAEFELDRRTSLDYPTGGGGEQFMATVQFDRELLGHDFLSLSNFGQADDGLNFDADVGPAPLITLDTGEDYSQLAQEFRLHSAPGPLSYIVGLYFFRADLFGFNSTRIVEADSLEGAPRPSPIHTEGIFDQITQAYSIFGQLTWRRWDRLGLTFGARWSHEKKSMHMIRRSNNGGVLIQGVGGEDFEARDSLREVDLAPKFSLIYDLSDDINYYLTLARGFKAGGYSSSTLQEDNLKFDREQADTIEMGFKGRFMSGAGRFNIGLFNMVFDNLQVTATDGTVFRVANAAKATSRGVEIDASVLPLDGLTVSGSLGYMDTFYNSFPTAPCKAGTPESEQDGTEDGSCDLSGAPLVNAPEWVFSLQLDYVAEFGAAWFAAPLEGYVGLVSSYQSESFLNLDEDPLDMRQPYWLHDLRAGLRSRDGRWQLTATVRNLLDEIYLVNSADVPFFAGAHWGTINNPRALSLALSLRY